MQRDQKLPDWVQSFGYAGSSISFGHSAWDVSSTHAGQSSFRPTFHPGNEDVIIVRCHLVGGVSEKRKRPLFVSVDGVNQSQMGPRQSLSLDYLSNAVEFLSTWTPETTDILATNLRRDDFTGHRYSYIRPHTVKDAKSR